MGKAEAGDPDTPWLRRRDWASGRIASGSGKAALGLAVFALLWNGFAWLMTAFVVPEALQKKEWGGLVILVFPAVGFALLAAAVPRVVRWLRFRRVCLRMQVPGVVGGHVRGWIETGDSLPGAVEATVSLSCARVTVTGSGKNRSTRRDVVWQDEHSLRLAPAGAGTGGLSIPFDFTVPSGLPDSALTADAPYHVWNLGVVSRIAGPDFHAAFEVPVFTTPESREVPVADAPGQAAGRAGAEASEGLAAVPRADGRQEFVLRPPWTIAQNLGCLIPAVLLVAGAIYGARRGVPLSLPIVAGALSVVPILLIVDGVFFPRRLVLGTGNLEIKGVCLGLITRRISLEGASGVGVVPGVETGANEGQVFWTVQLLYPPPRTPLTVTSSLRRKADAQRLAHEIRGRLPGRP